MTATSDSHSEPLQLRLVRAAMPLINQPAVAAMGEFSIRYEARVRAVLGAEVKLVTAALGISTPGARRRRSERAQARAMHPGRAASDRRGRPLINWHASGSGAPLLLINGWTASGLIWPSEWVRALGRDHRVIRLDNRGTGWSRTAPSPFTVADMADDAVAVMDALGIEKATVLGLSMGGMISQELALRHPDRVSRLILVATMPPKPAQISPDPALFFSSLRGPAPGQDLADYLRSMWGGFAAPGLAERDPAAMDELVAQVVARITPRQRVLDQARAIGCWHGARRLGRLEVPVTVIHGDADPLIPVANGRRLAELIPGAEYVEVAGAGHLLPYEAGDDLRDVIAMRA